MNNKKYQGRRGYPDFLSIENAGNHVRGHDTAPEHNGSLLFLALAAGDEGSRCLLPIS